MKIDIVSDTVCPWCFVGKRRLERALALRPGLTPDITWWPFQLNPDMPAVGRDRKSYLEAKFGGPAGAERIYAHIRDAGLSEGISFIWTPPDGKDRFGAPGQAGCSFISGLLMQGLCLLALMESADPRLISPVGSWPDSRFRLGGSRSDLFAITPCRTLRNLSACHLLCGLVFPVASRAHAGWLTKSR